MIIFFGLNNKMVDSTFGFGKKQLGEMLNLSKTLIYNLIKLTIFHI